MRFNTLPSDLLASVALLLSAKLTGAATASEWASRSIYQVMTDRFALSDGSAPECDLYRYCGGTWKGITNKLDYIQGMGFSAIQISPVVKNFPNHTIYGDAFHGYWPTDWYALNEHFGTADDLRDLAKALHDRDMLLMVDVVINDVALAIDKDMTSDTVIDYSQFNPFNEKKYFHPWCNLTTYFDPPIFQNCWLGSSVVALPDLNTEDPTVAKMITTWVQSLIANYSIDGLRIDAAKHVNDEFLQTFVREAGVFTFGEVYNEAIDVVCGYTRFLDGLPNFATYFPLVSAFSQGNMLLLGQMVESVARDCKNVSYMGTFLENHDLPRFPSINPDLVLAMNAISFTILADGIPTMYQNQEQHVSGNYSPFNRGALWTAGYNTKTPIYNLTATLNRLRSHAILTDPLYLSTPTTQLHLQEHYYVTRKGSEGAQVVAAYFNTALLPESSNETISIDGSFAPGTNIVEVLACQDAATDGDGALTFRMDGRPKAFYPAAKLDGSGLCGRALTPKVDESSQNTNNNVQGNNAANNATGEGGEKKSDGSRVKVTARFAIGGLAVVFVYAFAAL